jgi:hypothetical protein
MRRVEMLPMLVRQVGMSPEQWRRHLDRPVSFPKEEVKEETRHLIKIAKRPAMDKKCKTRKVTPFTLVRKKGKVIGS